MRLENPLRRLRRAACGCAALCMALCCVSCGAREHTASGYAMGSYVTQTAYTGDGALTGRVMEAILEAERILSLSVEDSAFARIARGERVELGEEILELLQQADALRVQSGGLFDIAVLPLTRLWNFDAAPEAPPDPDRIAQALARSGGGRIHTDGSAVWADAGSGIEPGAFGKGYACDAAVAQYRAARASGLISVGGSIGICGKKPNGDEFRVGVRDPFGGQTAFAGALLLSDCFVSTSGSYEKSFTYAGTLYHHILNPATGYPAAGGLVSVTAVGGSGALGDMLSTACFALGAEAALPLLKTYGFEAILIRQDRTILVTDGLRDRFEPAAGFEVEFVS